jgi:hypothetical protein
MSCTMVPSVCSRSWTTGRSSVWSMTCWTTIPCYSAKRCEARAQEDILPFLERFQGALEARGLAVKGITTDGSPLYPAPIREVFGPIAHQVCEFHVIAELAKAVLHAVAKVRKTLKARVPKLRRGRPSTEAQKHTVRRRKHLQARIADLFDHRRLFVKHRLTQAEKRTLARVRSAQKLFSPTLEKALTFLDDSLLPSTSNAVERGNRRHRKMQKTVYRVRTQEHIQGRIALDMQRDAQAEGRTQTIGLLHQVRACRMWN